MPAAPPERTIVAIPACNEQDHIAACLQALDRQSTDQVDDILLFLNNTSDRTAAVARQTPLRPGTTLHIIEQTLPPARANAGNARRLAMINAASLHPQDDRAILLTTDADSAVDMDWLAHNRAAIDAGADAVAGWVDLDPQDWSRIPLKLHEDDARECAYDALCDEIHARLDPDPADPLPRHTQHSGASIAVTLAAYRRAGGIPAIPCGEDRAFLRALRRIDSRIRHAPEVHVTVSGRIEGRAKGGMADTIRRRITAPDPFIDDRLEPAADCARRAGMRARLRGCIANPALIPTLALDAAVNPAWLARALATTPFGATWDALEANSPVLKPRRVAVADLAKQTAKAKAILAKIRPRQLQPVE